MAQFRVYQNIENNVWKLTFVNSPKWLSQADAFLMESYGEPEVNLGGTFLEGTDDQFTLPEIYARVRSDFPVTIDFDSRDQMFTNDIDVKVAAYKADILNRINDAFITLRANDDTFTGEQIYNI